MEKVKRRINVLKICLLITLITFFSATVSVVLIIGTNYASLIQFEKEDGLFRNEDGYYNPDLNNATATNETITADSTMNYFITNTLTTKDKTTGELTTQDQTTERVTTHQLTTQEQTTKKLTTHQFTTQEQTTKKKTTGNLTTKSKTTKQSTTRLQTTSQRTTSFDVNQCDSINNCNDFCLRNLNYDEVKKIYDECVRDCKENNYCSLICETEYNRIIFNLDNMQLECNIECINLCEN